MAQTIVNVENIAIQSYQTRIYFRGFPFPLQVLFIPPQLFSLSKIKWKDLIGKKVNSLYLKLTQEIEGMKWTCMIYDEKKKVFIKPSHLWTLGSCFIWAQNVMSTGCWVSPLRHVMFLSCNPPPHVATLPSVSVTMHSLQLEATRRNLFFNQNNNHYYCGDSSCCPPLSPPICCWLAKPN